MAHVHYKFSSKLNYDTVVFDGLHITLRDLKRQIMGREKLKAGDCDLQITNAQTKEEYTDEEAFIAKNSSVIIRRIPMGGVKSSSSKTHNIERSDHHHHHHHHHAFGVSKAMEDHSASRSLLLFSKTANLADADASEEDKIKAMMSQSNHDYDPMNYIKKQGPPPPANYTCYRCGKNGHHIRNCPTNGDKNYEAPPKIKKSTGIPRSFMVEVDDPSIKGAMLTNSGRYAIPTIDAEAYALGKKERPPFVPQLQPESEEEGEPIPDELLCLICKDLLSDAVVIPCCGNSYCDDCIRTALLDSEEHVCPTCSESDVSPDALIANKFLRQAVNNFKNERGYTKTLKKAASTSQTPTPTLTPTLSPIPTPPPLSTQTRPHRPYQPTRSQQDPLLPRPPASDTLPLAQLPGTPPIATGPASAYSTPCASPQPMETANKEVEAETPGNPVAATVPSVLVSPTDPSAAPSPLIPMAYHAPVASQPQPTSVNLQRSSSGPTLRHSGPPPNWESSSSSSSRSSGGWTHSDNQHLPPSHSSSSSSTTAAAPPPTIFPPPSLFSSPHFPPYLPGQQPLTSYPPGYPPTAPPWAPPNLPSAPIPSLSSSSSSSCCSIPPLIPKEELYRHQRRMKESPSSRVSGRARQKSKLDEMTNDFAKELLEYRKFQKERRRSYSRSPYRGSSYSRSSSRSYSRSHSSRSYSRSYSRSRSRSRGRSRSRSRSPYSRYRGGPPARPRASHSRCYGYRRSRSPTPSSSSSHRGGYRSRSRSPADYRNNHHKHHHGKRSASGGCNDRQRGERRSSAGRSQRNVEGAGGKAACYPYSQGGNQTHDTVQDRDRYRQWEGEYREWYQKYFSGYTGHPHHLPPLLPTPPPPHREDRGGGRNSPHSSHSDSRYRPQHRQATRRDSRSPPSQSSNESPSPPSQDGTQPMTYQQSCAEKYGRLPITLRPASKEPASAGRGKDNKQPIKRDSEDLKAPNHERQKMMRKEEQGGGRGEQWSSSPSALDSTDDGHKEERSNTIGPNVHSDSTPISDEPTASDALDSVPPPLELDKRLGKDREGKREGEGEEGPRRKRDPGFRPDREREIQVKTSREAGKTGQDSGRHPDSRSDKRKRKEEERERKEKERSLYKTYHSRSVKTELAGNDKTRKSESPKPFNSEKRQEKNKEKKAWGRFQPLTDREIWEEGMKVKPQKKISININLDGRKKEERTPKEELGELERNAEKGEEENTKTGRGEEAKESRGGEVEENEKREASGELEASFEEKTKQQDKGEKNGGEEEVVGEKKEVFDLWQSAFGRVEEDKMKKRRGETEEGGEKRRTSKREEETRVDRRRTRRGEEEEERVRRDRKGQEMRELVPKTQELMEGAKRRRRISEGEEDMLRFRSQRSRTRSHHRSPGPDGPSTMVDYGSITSTVGSQEGVIGDERQERRMVVKTLEEYTLNSSTAAEDEIVLIQVPRSKWEKEESEEEEQEEGEIKVQTDPPPGPVPPPSISMTTEIPTNRDERERQMEMEKERDRNREMERGKDREKEKHFTLSQSTRGLAPSGGQDRPVSTSPNDRERERDRERGRERKRDREREKEWSKERVRDEERQGNGERGRGRERERERSSTTSDRERKLPSSSSSHTSKQDRRDSGEKRTLDQDRRERERGSDQGSEKSSYSSSSRSSSRPESSSCRTDERKLSSSSRESDSAAMATKCELPDQNKHNTQRDKFPDLKHKNGAEDHRDQQHLHLHHRDPRDCHTHPDRPPGTHHPAHRSPPSPSRSLGRERDPLPSESPQVPQGMSEPAKPRGSSPGWGATQARLPSLIPRSVEHGMARRGAAECDGPRVEVPSVKRDDRQNLWTSRHWELSGVVGTKHPASPTEAPRSDGDREGDGKGEKLVSHPVREMDTAAFLPDLSESEEEEGKEGRDVADWEMKERGEREDRGSEAKKEDCWWEDVFEKWDRETKGGGGAELEEGERPSSRSSSVSSSASQEDGKKDRKKKEKKHKKHKKHKKEKRQASLELEEGELKKRKHKKKKSKKSKEGGEEGSSGEGDNGWKEEREEEEEEAKGGQTSGVTV